MAAPLKDGLLRACLAQLKNDYPHSLNGRSDEQTLSEMRPLLAETARLALKHDDNIMAYIILCFRHQTGYRRLMQHPETKAILTRKDLHEVERVYLLDEITGQQL